MSIYNRFFFILLAFLSCSTALAQDARLFGTLPTIQEVSLSPDGKKVGMIENRDGRTFIVSYPLGGDGDPVAVPISENSKARDLVWASNTYMLALVSRTQMIDTSDGNQLFEFYRYASIDAESGKAQYTFSGDANFENTTYPGLFLHSLPNKPKVALFAHYIPGTTTGRSSAGRARSVTPRGGLSLYEVNLKTGREKKVFNGVPETQQWVLNPKGEPIVRIDYDADDEKRKFVKIDGRKATVLKEYNEALSGGSVFTVQGLASDEKTVLVTAVRDSFTTGLHRMSLETGEFVGPVFSDAQYDISNLVVDRDTSTVIGMTVTREMPETIYFDENLQSLTRAMRRALASDFVSLVSSSKDKMVWVVRASFTDKPPIYYLFDRAQKELSILGATYPELTEPGIVRSEFDYTASDGTYIHGYLTVRENATASDLPLIVLPHGGPAARDTLSFDWWAGFYAARGYAVYQPNFRGSSGYGYRFRTAGYGEWGRKMQDDISEGVKKLIADGRVDPKRICIIGGSYGGYAALAGATLTPELYACAVSVNGVSDLGAMLGVEAKESEFGEAYWRRQIGNRFKDRDEIRSVSPYYQVENIRAPIMLIHGKEDIVVPFGQSRRMANALEKARKPFVFVELSGEDHYLSRGDTRIRMLEESISFIEKHLAK